MRQRMTPWARSACRHCHLPRLQTRAAPGHLRLAFPTRQRHTTGAPSRFYSCRLSLAISVI